MVAKVPIYLDYHASTPLDPRVTERVITTMTSSVGNPHSESHALGWRARDLVEGARAVVAEAVGADPHEVIFTSGATEADNIGVLGAAMGAPSWRRRILVTAFEHKAVLEAARAAEQLGFRVELIKVSASGQVDLEDLAARLSDDVAVVSVMAVNNEIGTIQPIAEVAEMSAAVGAFVHTDATQAPLAMQVDLKSWAVDGASFSSHKIHGPKGVGALILSDLAPWRPRPLMFGGGQEQGLRPGTLPTALCAGFGEAFTISAQEGAGERARVRELRDQFVELLRGVAPQMKVTGADAPRHPGSLHVRFPGVDADDLLARLQPSLCASTGSACTSGHIQTSHVLSALGWSVGEAREAIRFSLGRFSTADEISAASDLIGVALGSAARRAA